jgi:hypothetical protein
MADIDTTPTTITIHRELGQGQPHTPAFWIYSYDHPTGEAQTRGDGTEFIIAKGQRVTYGRGLGSFKDQLRRQFGRKIKFSQTW